MKRFKTSAMPSSICRASLFLSVFFFCCLFSACSDDSEVLEPEKRNEWKFVKGKMNGEPLLRGFDDINCVERESGVIDTFGIRTINEAYWSARVWLNKNQTLALCIGLALPLTEGNYTLKYSREESSLLDSRAPYVSISGKYFPSEIPAELHIEKVYDKDWSVFPFVVGRLEGKFIRYDDPTDVIYLEDVEFQIH